MVGKQLLRKESLLCEAIEGLLELADAPLSARRLCPAHQPLGMRLAVPGSSAPLGSEVPAHDMETEINQVPRPIDADALGYVPAQRAAHDTRHAACILGW